MIDQFAKEMFSNLQAQAENLKGVRDFSEKQLRAAAEKTMKNLNLVSREEFEIQQAVLERSREKIEALEQQMSELEQKLADS
jgi:BMFP domain-containing protein YqiC